MSSRATRAKRGAGKPAALIIHGAPEITYGCAIRQPNYIYQKYPPHILAP